MFVRNLVAVAVFLVIDYVAFAISAWLGFPILVLGGFAVLGAFSEREAPKSSPTLAGVDRDNSQRTPSLMVADVAKSALMASDKQDPEAVLASAEDRHDNQFVERIIERQVIVTRCQFCKELTPVDLSDCKNCGAKV